VDSRFQICPHGDLAIQEGNTASLEFLRVTFGEVAALTGTTGSAAAYYVSRA
jgi:hypothetical protein